MIKQLNKGVKSQTRRLMKPQPHYIENLKMWSFQGWNIEHEEAQRRIIEQYSKYGQIGEILIVEGSTILLRITNIRIERIQDISVRDAMSEGLHNEFDGTKYWYSPSDRKDIVLEYGDHTMTPRPCVAFKALWNSIYKNWNDNPWAWAYDFEII